MKRCLILLILLFSQYVSASSQCLSRTKLHGWASVDYLYTWQGKSFCPSLVTTCPNGEIPRLNNPTTEVLFGGEKEKFSNTSGVRADLGWWVFSCLGGGVSGLFLGPAKCSYSINNTDPDNNIIIGRPYFDVDTNQPAALQISNGEVKIFDKNNIWDVDCYARYKMINGCCFNFDLIGGFRYMELSDNLKIYNSDQATGTTFTDHFDTKNQLYSCVLGGIFSLVDRCFRIQVDAKVGFGNTLQKADIYGQRSVSGVGGSRIYSDYGFLTLPSNIGNYSRHKFAFVPEVDAQLMIKVFSCAWIKAGYQYMYWSDVELAGGAINLNISPIAAAPPQNSQDPTFSFKDASFSTNSLSVGIYFVY